jgi:tRNA dimethylallyltransferase
LAASTKKVVFVVGPTAGGKSAAALEAASRAGGSIVNIDSVQFYQGLEIGSAAPTAKEKKQVPHYLYSYIPAPREMTAGKYLDDFYKLLEAPQLKFPLFIVGGTGFYIQALEKGLYDIEPIPENIRIEIEEELADKGAEVLFAELKLKDPQTQIHINDHYRLVRALEIVRTTGKTPSQMKADQEYKKKQLPFAYIKTGYSFEKEIFLQRVQRRTRQMIKEGLIEETEYFLKHNFSDWSPLSSVGFKETVQFLQEGKTKDWLYENVVQSTMKLIKKQKTWFKRDSSILWSDQQAHIDRFLLED